MISFSDDFFENNPHPMLVFDSQSKTVLSINPAMCNFLDRARQDILSQNVDQMMNAHFGGRDWRRDVASLGGDVQLSDATFASQPAQLLAIYQTGEPAYVDRPMPGAEQGPAPVDDTQKLFDRVQALQTGLERTVSLGKTGQWEVNCATREVMFSPQILDIFAPQNPDSFLNYKDIQSLVHPDDRKMFDRRVQRALSTQGPYASLHRIIRGDGDIRYLREEGKVVGDGDTRTFQGRTEDITELFMAQKAAERSAVQMSDVGEIAKVGGWEYDAETGIVLRSEMVARIYGDPECMRISLEEARQQYAPECVDRHKKVWSDCLKSGKAFDEIMEIITVQGERKWVRFAGTAVWNQDKTKVATIRGALQDVSAFVFARQQAEAMSNTLEETLEAISDSFMTVDREWRITFANESACNLMGKPRYELLKENVWELFPEGVGGTFHWHYETAMRTGETQRFTAKSTRSGKWLEVNAYATSHGLAISARDVSGEHARDEQLLLLETAVSRLNDIVIITSAEPNGDLPAHHLVFVNEAFEATTGYSSDHILGQTIEFLHGPGTQVEDVMRIQSALQKQQPARLEILNYTKDGAPIWLDLEILPIKKVDESKTYWVTVARDVTERKENEQRIHLNEERFRLVAAASNDVIWDCDLRSGKMWWNDKLLKVFGHDAEEFDDRLNWWDANLHPEDQEAILGQMQSIIDGPEKLWALNYRFRKADGSYAQVHDKGSVLRDENGVATRILGTMTDVSERLNLEEQLRQSQKMEAIGKLTGGVAHDFNNLLAIIMGNLELLKEEMRRGELHLEDAFGLIDAGISAVRRGSDLTGHMLAYARKARLAPVETDLNEVARETTSWMRRTIDSSIQIEMDLAISLWRTRVDPNLLQNAIVNLILNARDVLSEGGRITIETRNIAADDARFDEHGLPAGQNGFVMLSISDNGPGIEAPNLQQVFDPFFTTKPVGQGSGLGLSMVQGFVSQSGGEIRMFSEPGKGTRLDLYFKPFVSDTQKRVPTLQQSAGATGHEEPHILEGRILVVEDDPAVRRMLERTLVNSGFEVVTEENGDAALKMFKQDHAFDLVLTDVSMPGSLHGFELAQACRDIRPGIPIIFLSGHATENLPAYDALASEGLRLMKPLSRDDLIEAVRSKIKTPASQMQDAFKRTDAL